MTEEDIRGVTLFLFVDILYFVANKLSHASA